MTRTAPSPTVASAAQTAAAIHNSEYLSFTLGQEEYGIDILKVQEIRSYEEPTHIANAPAFIKGVVNLRGIIVPIVDMRMLILVDIEKLMGGADMALVDQTTLQ